MLRYARNDMAEFILLEALSEFLTGHQEFAGLPFVNRVCGHSVGRNNFGIEPAPMGSGVQEWETQESVVGEPSAVRTAETTAGARPWCDNTFFGHLP